MSKEVFIKIMNDVRVVYTTDKKIIKSIPEDFQWSELFRKSKLCVFAKSKGKLVGASCIRGVLNISMTRVNEGYRGKGIGTTLLKNAITFAEKENYSFVSATIGTPWAKRIVQKSGGFRKEITVGKQTVIIWPLGSVAGNFASICVCTLFSLIPQPLRKKFIGHVAQVA